MKCEGCGGKTTCAHYCQRCKSKRFHARKRIDAEGLILDEAGGAWWVWDAKGTVLVIGKNTKQEAFNALAFEEDGDA